MSAYDLELEGDAEGVVVASLTGELDLTNAHEVEERLAGAASSETILVIDLNRVVFIDSAALHVLFKLAERRPKDGLVLVMESNAAVARTLDIVRMKDAVGIVASLDDLERPGSGLTSSERRRTA